MSSINWDTVLELAAPLVSYLVAFFVHRPKKRAPKTPAS